MKNIFVLGNTGSGKSTFLDNFVKKYHEEFDNKPYYKYGILPDTYNKQDLEEFYSNPKKFAFKNELPFLMRAINNMFILDYERFAENILLDRSFLDIIIFTESLNQLNMLTLEQYKILKSYNDITFNLFINKIDLLVYLESDIYTLISNIKNRSRKEETDNLLQNSFYELLIKSNVLMDDMVMRLITDNKLKVLRLKNVSRLDQVEYDKNLDFMNLFIEKLE